MSVHESKALKAARSKLRKAKYAVIETERNLHLAALAYANARVEYLEAAKQENAALARSRTRGEGRR